VNVKKHLFALGLVAAMASPAFAADDILPPSDTGPFSITGNVALTSEYFFRGFSQSNDSPAVQGGLNLNYKLNDMFTATAGAWASNVDSGIANGNIELDYVLGLSAAVTPELTVGVGSTWYTYPGTSNDGSEPDFWEASLTGTYNFGLFSVTGLYAYSPDFNLNSGEAHYLNGKVVVPLGYVDLSGAVGKQWIEENEAFGAKDYLDWKIAAGAKVWGIDLELAYIDTDISEAFPGGGETQAADGAVIFTVTKNF